MRVKKSGSGTNEIYTLASGFNDRPRPTGFAGFADFGDIERIAAEEEEAWQTTCDRTTIALR